RSLGVKRGERILLMLGNEVPLWETMLAAIKLGAVVIPATTLLSADDLRDRISRGQVRHVVVGQAHIERFAGLADHCTRIVVGAAAPGWQDFADSRQQDSQFVVDGDTHAND